MIIRNCTSKTVKIQNPVSGRTVTFPPGWVVGKVQMGDGHALHTENQDGVRFDIVQLAPEIYVDLPFKSPDTLLIVDREVARATNRDDLVTPIRPIRATPGSDEVIAYSALGRFSPAWPPAPLVPTHGYDVSEIGLWGDEV